MSNPASRAHVIVSGSKIPAAIGTPEPLSVAPLLCSMVTIIASRGRTANTGIVYLGSSSVNDAQLFPLALGTSIQLFADNDNLLDLSQIYVDAATVTDGVQYIAVCQPNL